MPPASKPDKSRSHSKTASGVALPTDTAAVDRLIGSQASHFRVKSTSVSGAERRIVVENGRGAQSVLRAQLFALVGPGDTLHIDPSRSGRLFVCSEEGIDDSIKVSPHFERRVAIRVGAIEYELVIKEITTTEDLEHYAYLEGFHYKTSSAIVSEEGEPESGRVAVGGRKSVLLAYLSVGRRLMPAGYVELHMPLMMVKPRHQLFAHGFTHPTRPVAWAEWDMQSLKQYVNLIVRIARVVMSPDLRGLGLARVLITTAKEFSRERWHVRGRRPLFMEISAEMLKYMDFATSAGLHFAGQTEGNLSRVHKDLLQMRRGQKLSFGMMTLQKKYLSGLEALADTLGRSLPEVLDRIKELTTATDETTLREKLNSLAPQEWYMFKRVLRFPIPYYLCGLDEASEDFIRRHVPKPPVRVEVRPKPVVPARINLSGVQVSSTYRVPDSPQSRAIRDCFGLDGSVFQTSLVGPLTIEASGGNIILITGASGSGKSVLLNVLDPSRRAKDLSVTMRDLSSQPYQVEWMSDIHSELPIIEYFSEKWGIDSSISALNQAGLSEAFVYLRPYRQLSRGQQYRARIAALRLGAAPVWLMDEFCADLDPFTARVVASNLRKHVIAAGRIAILAAANNAHYIDALRPTRVIYLRHNGKSETLTYGEYINEFCIKPG